MDNIQRADSSLAGPVYDLGPAAEVEELDQLVPAGEISTEPMAIQPTVDTLLGLRDISPQSAALSPPAPGDLSLTRMTGPQARGQLRKILLNFQYSSQQLQSRDLLRQEGPEMQSMKNRLDYVAAAMELLEGLSRDQDSILTHVVVEQKQ